MEFTYRTAKVNELPLIIDFINYVFSYDHRPHDFKKLVPKVYGDNAPENMIHFIAANEMGQIVAAVGLITISLNIDHKTLKCGFIGSVSVHPYYRSQGHMIHLMNMANEYLKSHNFDLAILDGLRQRYEYYGYCKCGTNLRYEILAENIRHALKNISTKNFRITELTGPDDSMLDAVHKLYSDQPVFVCRKRDALPDTMRNFGNRLFVVTYNHEFIGYFTALENNSITEFYLTEDDYYSNVIKLWMNLCCAPSITITLMPHQHTLQKSLNSFAENILIQRGSNIKVFDFKHVISVMLEYQKLLLGKLPDGECYFKIEDCPIHIRCACNSISVDGDIAVNASQFSAMEFTELMFAPMPLPKTTGISGLPADYFPIPLSLSMIDEF